VGFTGDDVDKLCFLAETDLFDVVQTFRHYTLTNQAAGTALLPAAVRRHMGVINGSPLGMGLLTGGDPRIMTQPAPPDLQRRAECMQDLARRLGIGLPELAIRFSLSQPAISVTIPGTKSVARLEQNVAAWQAGPLPEDVLAEIAVVNAGCP
jgi:aryl-alcohol dehydrogenase-like predicted oxidoreductase